MMEDKKMNQPRIKNPIDLFFKLGDKITKNDPVRQQEFTYYMLWILFLAFLGLFFTNLFRFIKTLDPWNLIWSAVGFAIMSLQYLNLRNFYQMRKARIEFESKRINEESENKIEDVDEMLKGFTK